MRRVTGKLSAQRARTAKPKAGRRVLVIGDGGNLYLQCTLDDRVDRASFLAEATINALDHVDVVAGGPARAVIAPRSRFDGDGLRGADRLTELTGDAPFLAVGVSAQRVLAAKARRDRPLLKRVIQRRLWLEEIAHRQPEGLHELLEDTERAA